MSKELVLHGWQLVAFAFANQGLMLAAIAFVMWADKRAKGTSRCDYGYEGCGCNEFSHKGS